MRKLPLNNLRNSRSRRKQPLSLLLILRSCATRKVGPRWCLHTFAALTSITYIGGDLGCGQVYQPGKRGAVSTRSCAERFSTPDDHATRGTSNPQGSQRGISQGNETIDGTSRERIVTITIPAFGRDFRWQPRGCWSKQEKTLQICKPLSLQALNQTCLGLLLDSSQLLTCIVGYYFDNLSSREIYADLA